ncbi:MAG: 16S rRNA (guanine(527)-N(7))-methyltransferase RsmG [Clostridia bacterium]|nr:16S rRNA (guanine(527)-N(7))-methyltransferase RsmG [Clostridia bacterium]
MIATIMKAHAEQMGLTLTDGQCAKFAAYHAMLIDANAKFNLTRVPDDPEEAVDRNYLDSIALLTKVSLPAGAKVADVGSGAGFPGIPLAIMCPDVHFVLIDALDKRVRFLNEVIDALGLNAEAIHGRAEQTAHADAYREQFDYATARAVADLRILSEYLLPFVKVGGSVLSLKGPGASDEATDAAFAIETLGGKLNGIDTLPIPNRDWQHCLVRIDKVASTPDTYPRKAGIPEKRPLKAKK